MTSLKVFGCNENCYRVLNEEYDRVKNYMLASARRICPTGLKSRRPNAPPRRRQLSRRYALDEKTAEAKEFRKRWKLVAREINELRAQTEASSMLLWRNAV